MFLLKISPLGTNQLCSIPAHKIQAQNHIYQHQTDQKTMKSTEQYKPQFNCIRLKTQISKHQSKLILSP
jgi:hypothetical protein